MDDHNQRIKYDAIILGGSPIENSASMLSISKSC